MTARAIEDWLTKASERSYQAAFCHLLNAMGYSVIHSTTHGPTEEGKDVIARNSQGTVYAIQLKRGNINVSDWRSIKPEMEELTELPVNHPSVKPGTRHVPLLVTTGYIHENVASRIAGMNRQLAARRFKKLITWTGSELLMSFIEHSGGFLPQPLPDFHRLLGFMIAKGDGPLDKPGFDLLIRSVLPVGRDPRNTNRNTVIRAITASAIIGEYALGAYDRMLNSYAKIEAYVMLFCYIRATAIAHRIPEKDWKPSVELLESTVDGCVGKLMEELRQPHYFGQGDPLTEPVVAPYRNTVLGGVLSAHGIWYKLGGPSEWYADSRDKVVDTVASLSKNSAIPSEAFIPPRFLSSTYLRHNGHVRLGQNMFNELLHIAILRKHKGPGVMPLWGVYVPLEEAILRELGKHQQSVSPEPWEIETSTGHSLLVVAASRLMRRELQSLWHAITNLHFAEFVPDRGYENLLWNNKRGKMVQTVARQPQSWEQLLQEVRTSEKLPHHFKGYEHWIPYYLTVYPQRFSPSIVLALERLMNASD